MKYKIQTIHNKPVFKREIDIIFNEDDSSLTVDEASEELTKITDNPIIVSEYIEPVENTHAIRIMAVVQFLTIMAVIYNSLT